MFTPKCWYTISLCLCSVFFFGLSLARAADADNTPQYFLRLERGTRSEDVCVLVRSDGQFHLERIAPGVFQRRIYEGTFPADQVAQLRQMLDNDKLKSATQQQIKMELVNEDQDQLLLAINRATGWQTLHFPSGASRKPYKDSLDPLLKWLDRAKQQQHAIPYAVANRCIPPEGVNGQSQTASASSNPSTNGAAAEIKGSEKNPYLVRWVEDYTSTSQQNTTSIETMRKVSVDAEVERTCMIVYNSGKYRVEKTKQLLNDKPRSQVFLNSLSQGQIGELKQLLSDPQVANLEHTTDAVVGGIREGDIINLDIPRAQRTQVLSFATRFGVRTQAIGMKDNLTTQVDEELNNIKPLRKWLKSNVEDKKGSAAKDEAANTCLPEK